MGFGLVVDIVVTVQLWERLVWIEKTKLEHEAFSEVCEVYDKFFSVDL